jgi:hypothetical protein
MEQTFKEREETAHKEPASALLEKSITRNSIISLKDLHTKDTAAAFHNSVLATNATHRASGRLNRAATLQINPESVVSDLSRIASEIKNV